MPPVTGADAPARWLAVGALVAASLAGASSCTDTNNNAPVIPGAIDSDAGAGGGEVDATTGGGTDARVISVNEPGYLWYAGTALAAFTKSQAKASSDAGPAISLVPDYPSTNFHDLTFDGAGNLWALPGSGDRILRLPAAELGTLGPPKPDLVITSDALKSAQSMAFDAAGNLWVMSYAGAGLSTATVARFDDPRAATGDTPMIPSATIGPSTSSDGLASLNQGSTIAFDGAGSLWVATVASVLRIDHPGSLQGSVAAQPAAIISTGDAYVSIAFDSGGALWISGADNGYVALRFADPGSLTGIVSPTEAARLRLPSNGAFYASGMAFDAAGALWIAMDRQILAFPGASALTGDASPTPAVVLGVKDAPDVASKLIFRP
jgi:ligand-binding sensor domain-containing protein